MTIPTMSERIPASLLHPGRFFYFWGSRMAFAISSALLFGCAGFGGPPPALGDQESAVVAKLGRPTHVFQDSEVRILEYMTGPFGQTTHFAKISGNGQLISYAQVLTSQKFALIVIGRSTKTNVLQLIGTPSQTTYLDLPQLEVWSYPYQESPVSDSIMHVHFNHSGVVQKILNAPDLRRDSDYRTYNLRGGVLGRMP